MTKPANTESIEQATGITWDEWVTFLEANGAAQKPHGEIAQLAHDTLTIPSAAWWAQAVAVAYEQHIGRREAGQNANGSYEASVSRTVAGSREEVFTRLSAELDSLTTIAECAVQNRRTSVTPVRSYWRCNLDRGDKIAVAVEAKADSKVLIVATHTNLSSAILADDARTYWKQRLANY